MDGRYTEVRCVSEGAAKISVKADLGIGSSVALFVLVHLRRMGYFKADSQNLKMSSFSSAGISCLCTSLSVL
jgi:hypothetical protein